jgi:hypothetical protein
LRASAVYEAAGIAAPFILGVMLRTRQRLFGAYAGFAGLMEQTPPVPARNYSFPHMQVDDLSAIDRAIRPLCDQAHQMFGLAGSRSFNAEGVWVAQYA